MVPNFMVAMPPAFMRGLRAKYLANFPADGLTIENSNG